MSDLDPDQPDHVELILPSGLGADVLVGGDGAPVLFLHGHLGRSWDPFLTGLGHHFRVVAPLHPGALDPDELLELDGFDDLALYYDDLLTALGLDRVTVVGHGFGAMAGAELAARHRDRVGRLVLMAPLGLWRDDEPIPDISSVPRRTARAMLSDSEAVVSAVTALPDDPVAAADLTIERTLIQAAVSHFIWPIPDRDLRRRLYRITCPTLVIWGAEDRYVPASYGQDFADGLADATLHTIAGAGHLVHLEAGDEVVGSIRSHGQALG